MNASFKERKIAPDVLELLDAKNAIEVMEDLGDDAFIIIVLILPNNKYTSVVLPIVQVFTLNVWPNMKYSPSFSI